MLASSMKIFKPRECDQSISYMGFMCRTLLYSVFEKSKKRFKCTSIQYILEDGAWFRYRRIFDIW